MFLQLCVSFCSQGGSLSRGVSVQGVLFDGGLCSGVSVKGVCPGGLCQGGLHLGGLSFQSRGVSVQGGLSSQSRGVSVQGVSLMGVCVQGGLWLGEYLSGGSLSRGISVGGGFVSGENLCLWGSLSGRPPVRYKAGGTYPTGMHSCFLILQHMISQ